MLTRMIERGNLVCEEGIVYGNGNGNGNGGDREAVRPYTFTAER